MRRGLGRITPGHGMKLVQNQRSQKQRATADKAPRIIVTPHGQLHAMAHENPPMDGSDWFGCPDGGGDRRTGSDARVQCARHADETSLGSASR